MARVLLLNNQRYRPVLTKNGKLNVRTAVAYGTVGKGQFMLTVYVSCVYVNAGKRGGKIEAMDVRAWRETVDNTMSEDDQRTKLEFALNVCAHTLDCDYELRLPIETKATPKYSQHKLQKT